MFLQVSVCPRGGGIPAWYPSMPCSRGGAIPACIAGGIPACLATGLQGGCLIRGVPDSGGSASGGACSWGAEGCGDPPESRRLLLRTVRILLECILAVFAGPKAKQLEGEECPLHVKHPPTGEEFALGCGVCRNAHTF